MARIKALPRPSGRGLNNLKFTPMMDLQREKEKYPDFEPTKQPDGIIDISSSINVLMRSEIDDWVEQRRDSIWNDFKDGFTQGSTAGSPELMTAVARYTNKFFAPDRPIDPSSILAANGVSALLSILAFNICDAGEGIMVEVPNYGMFETDITYQNNITLVRVATADLEDRFAAGSSDALIQAYEDALEQAEDSGINVRAILLCNPCNPLGRCYSRTTLENIHRFCVRNRLHLIVDEIYALSVTTEDPDMDGFTSALSLSLPEDCESENIHVVSGVSKDFGLHECRIGWLITRNELLWQAVRRLWSVSADLDLVLSGNIDYSSCTTWVTSSSDRLVSRLLADEPFLEDYAPKLRSRLSKSRSAAAAQLREMNVPFSPANAGLFMYIDLSRWVAMYTTGYPASGAASEDTRNHEMRFASFLMQKGIFLQPDTAFLDSDTGKFRFVYTSNDIQTTTLGLRRLESALREIEDRHQG